MAAPIVLYNPRAESHILPLALVHLGSMFPGRTVHVVDGRLEPLERVRTSSRALERLEEIVVAEAGEREVDLAVHHLAAEQAAGEVAERLRQRLPESRRMVVSEVGAVLGAHVGPGMVAVVVSPVG